jgi:Pyridoxamine 5'-phosphate oxidase
MREDSADLRRLQRLVDQSIENASPYLREAYRLPAHSLSAGQLARYLEGAVPVAVGTVSSKAEPKVVPVDSIFFRGRFFIPTFTNSLRVRHLRRNHAISLAHYIGEDVAIIVHGHAGFVEPPEPFFTELDQVYASFNGQGAADWCRERPSWGNGIYIEVAADRLISYVSSPEDFPG